MSVPIAMSNIDRSAPIFRFPVNQKARGINKGLRSATFLLAASVFMSQPVAVMAQEARQFETLPDRFVGMMNGTVQPNNTFRAYINSAQTSPASSGGQTGRQFYNGGFSYRGDSGLQFGAGLAVFDDVPAEAINGSNKSVTYVAPSIDLKYQYYASERLSAAVQFGAEAVFYSRGSSVLTLVSDPPDIEDRFFAATLSLPVTYQLNDQLWVTGEVGYSHFADVLAGDTGFGGRAFASAGVAYQPTERLFAYASVKSLLRQIDDGIDAPAQGAADLIYTVGAQYAMTPQSVLNLYVTNAFSSSTSGDDLLFYPDKDQPLFGVLLSYIPSGRGVQDNAVTFRPAQRSDNGRSRFADGFTIKSPHTLAADRLHARLAYGSAGQSAVSLQWVTDPDFQFELSFEDYGMTAGSNFRSEDVENLRYFVGGHWQAMDEAYGQPFNLGLYANAGRNMSDPSIGVLFGGATASKSFDWGALAVNGRGGIYAAEKVAGVGVSASYDINESLTAIGEVTYVMDDDPVWAIGMRHDPEPLPFAFSVYATNAIGMNGIGSLVSNDTPQFGVMLHWEGDWDLF